MRKKRLPGGTIKITQSGSPRPCTLDLSVSPSTNFSYYSGPGRALATPSGNCPLNSFVRFYGLFPFADALPVDNQGNFTIPANVPPADAPLTFTPARSGTISAVLYESNGAPLGIKATITITQSAYQLPPENLCVQDPQIKGSDIVTSVR